MTSHGSGYLVLQFRDRNIVRHNYKIGGLRYERCTLLRYYNSVPGSSKRIFPVLHPLQINTFAPSLANVIAVAFPMPVDAPVTSATFPSSLPDMTV